MEVKTITADAIFRVFTACPTDPRTLILDVRDRKHFERAPGHVAGAYCIRLSSNGAVLLDYSKREDLKWAADCWWDRDVIVYGDAGLKKDHPVVAFLSQDKHVRSLSIYREGLEAFHKAYPFLVTTSVKAGAASSRRYPSQLAPLLYLGDWSHAEAVDRHAELGIKAILTIHNHPDNLKLPPGRYTHKQIEMADVDTADIGPQLAPAYDCFHYRVYRGSSC
jgi:dual specificity MAP kinase phosphatase